MPSCGTCPVHPCCEAAPHSPPATPFCPAPAPTRSAAACLRPGRQARAPSGNWSVSPTQQAPKAGSALQSWGWAERVTPDAGEWCQKGS